jgi:surface carbohydrate biosynthesis protein
VENQVRELDARLLLACAAAERGFPVILGSRSFISLEMPNLEPGIFVAKSMRPRSRLMFNIIRDLGHVLVAWDEESLVRYPCADEYYRWRFSPDTFAPLSALFAWGPDDAAMFANYPGYNGAPIHVTGNPRIDLLRSELRGCFRPDVDALRGRFGEFILINTNFSFVNAFVRKLTLVLDHQDAARARVSRTGEGLSLEFARGLASHQQAIFDGFRRLLPKLSAWFPDRQIVLRPHPSEDHAAWRRILSGLHNVHVIHQGNVAPWLQACRVLIHNGCTTAVEAAVLGTPAIAYRPVTSDLLDYTLPNTLSHEAFTEAAVRELAEAILNGSLGLVDETVRRGCFERHLAATTGPFAVDRAIAVLERMPAASSPPHAGRALLARLKAAGRAAVKRINLARRGHWNSAEYHAHRFPEIGEAEINERIERFARLLGRFEGIRAQRISRFIFRIEPATDARAAPALAAKEVA